MKADLVECKGKKLVNHYSSTCPIKVPFVPYQVKHQFRQNVCIRKYFGGVRVDFQVEMQLKVQSIVNHLCSLIQKPKAKDLCCAICIWSRQREVTLVLVELMIHVMTQQFVTHATCPCSVDWEAPSAKLPTPGVKTVEYGTKKIYSCVITSQTVDFNLNINNLIYAVYLRHMCCCFKIGYLAQLQHPLKLAQPVGQKTEPASQQEKHSDRKSNRQVSRAMEQPCFKRDVIVFPFLCIMRFQHWSL